MKEPQDLFEDYKSLPQPVQDILLTFVDASYGECERLLSELKPHGYTFDYGLDGEPYNLTKI